MSKIKDKVECDKKKQHTSEGPFTDTSTGFAAVASVAIIHLSGFAMGCLLIRWARLIKLVVDDECWLRWMNEQN